MLRIQKVRQLEIIFVRFAALSTLPGALIPLATLLVYALINLYAILESQDISEILVMRRLQNVHRELDRIRVRHRRSSLRVL